MRDADGALTVVALTVDGGRITAIDVIRDPDKLTAAAGLLARTPLRLVRCPGQAGQRGCPGLRSPRLA